MATNWPTDLLPAASLWCRPLTCLLLSLTKNSEFKNISTLLNFWVKKEIFVCSKNQPQRTVRKWRAQMNSQTRLNQLTMKLLDVICGGSISWISLCCCETAMREKSEFQIESSARGEFFGGKLNMLRVIR